MNRKRWRQDGEELEVTSSCENTKPKLTAEQSSRKKIGIHQKTHIYSAPKDKEEDKIKG